MIKQFEDLTMIQEEQGEFHMKEHDIVVVKNQLSKSIEELKESTIEVVVSWAHKGIIYILIIIVIGILISQCLKRTNEDQITHNTHETMYIQELRDKYAYVRI